MSEKTVAGKRHTQAVIIIHGIGEQWPMSTLRNFVDAVLPKPEDGGEKYFSKPDRLSQSYELRKLQNRSLPRTHFFEYYWAYQVEGTTFEHIRAWLATLLWRKPGSVPRNLRLLWSISWFLILVTLAALSLGIWSSWGKEAQTLFGAKLMELTGQFSPWFISTVSAALLGLINYVVFQYVGDVARYLTPLPGNIKLRQTIRREGVDLLKRIHEGGEYERVILVGHSLGSVIAYDLLKELWQEYQEVYKTPRECEQEALAHLEKVGDCLQRGVQGVTVDEYRQAQLELWQEMRSLGNPWLVTDLVTLGSPLAHAALLLASDPADLQARQRQRELPTCPPQGEMRTVKGQKHCFYSYKWDPYADRQAINLSKIHHGGYFAFTRWTNLYFPGDLVGGPITEFGPGILNLPVRTGKWLVDRTLRAHTRYWDAKAGKENANAVAELVRALDLKNEAFFTGGPDQALTAGSSPGLESQKDGGNP
jgi:hypothetical protein